MQYDNALTAVSAFYIAISAKDQSIGSSLFSAKVMKTVSEIGIESDEALARAIQVADRGFVLGQFWGSGRKTYEVAPALQERLLHTEVRGITCDMVRPQFKSFSVRVDPDLFNGVREIIVSEAQGIELDEGQHAPDIDPMMFRSFRVCYYMRTETIGSEIGYFSLPMSKGYPFEDRISEIEGQLTGRGATVARFIANVILYLTWPDEGETFEERISPDYKALQERMLAARGNKREKLKARLRAMDPDKRIYIGAKVPFMSGGPEGDFSTGDSLLVRTLVAGHWKMQPCGPKQSERKLIRVEPYWRGPADGVVSNPIRKVV